ncbi:MAG: pseudouridine synthase [Candidatus Sulfotelmatobacter sp.]
MRQKTIRRFGLARALSKLGYCSRSHAAELIRAGRVTLNGEICRNPEAPVRSPTQIAVDGSTVEEREKIYIMLNKPRGLITTASDEKGRETVYSLLNQHSGAAAKPHEDPEPWIAPVGRLDKASEGLLLLTNDSEWGARIATPETHLEKSYHVQIGTVADEELIKGLLRGVETEEGTKLRAKQVRRLRAGQKNCWLEITLDEGKNRHIRRMMKSMDIEVLRLVRVAIGPVKLGDLAKGEWRVLTPDEKLELDRAMRSTK